MIKELPPSTADKHLRAFGKKGCSGASTFIGSHGTGTIDLFRSFWELYKLLTSPVLSAEGNCASCEAAHPFAEFRNCSLLTPCGVTHTWWPLKR